MSPNAHQETPFESIKTRAIKGIALLTARTFILQAISFLAMFFLTVFLSPADFGIFFIVTAAVTFFAYFSDIGLAAALIQKKDSLTENDLRTTFTIQQILVFAIFILIILLTPLLVHIYKLNDQSVYLLWALALSLILSSLKTIPSVLLERDLKFDKLVVPQIVEAFVYNIVAVALAGNGFGVMSFTIAVLLRGIAGLITLYIIRPWRPGFALSKDSLKNLLLFGAPYQLNTFLALIKDDGLTAYLGVILGASGVGYLGWAQKWASAPLRFFMDTVIKVTFPAFSRMQDDKKFLSRAANRSIFFISLLVFPSLIGLITTAPLIVEIIPKYDKWSVALLALSIISINSAFAAVTTPLTNVLNAIGKIKVTFKLMIFWTILSWVIIPVLAIFYGVNGVAYGYALIGVSSIIAIRVAIRYVDIDFIGSILRPLLAASVMGVLNIFLIFLMPKSFLTLITVMTLGVVVYLAILYLIFGKQLVVDVKKFIDAFKGKALQS